jgi:hypothetical protein
MEAAKSGDDWHDDAVAQPVETRHGDGSLKTGVARGNTALDGQRTLLHKIQSVGQCGAKLCRCEAVLAALEQLDAGLTFKAGESSADRRLGRSKRSGRRAERAVARDGESDLQVVPIHD